MFISTVQQSIRLEPIVFSNTYKQLLLPADDYNSTPPHTDGSSHPTDDPDRLSNPSLRSNNCTAQPITPSVVVSPHHHSVDQQLAQQHSQLSQGFGAHRLANFAVISSQPMTATSNQQDTTPVQPVPDDIPAPQNRPSVTCFLASLQPAPECLFDSSDQSDEVRSYSDVEPSPPVVEISVDNTNNSHPPPDIESFLPLRISSCSESSSSDSDIEFPVAMSRTASSYTNVKRRLFDRLNPKTMIKTRNNNNNNSDHQVVSPASRHGGVTADKSASQGTKSLPSHTADTSSVGTTKHFLVSPSQGSEGIGVQSPSGELSGRPPTRPKTRKNGGPKVFELSTFSSPVVHNETRDGEK